MAKIAFICPNEPILLYLWKNKTAMATIIGRKTEIRELLDSYNKDQAQLVAIYGRRRVGKTFLVDEALKGKITFRHAGLSPVDEIGKKNLLKDQLKHFYNSLRLHGMPRGKCPSSWLDAFFMLEEHLQQKDNGEKQVVFLDELPWMDTPRSGFLTAFEGFWNGWGCHRDNLMVVVCGSANSWILDNLIHNHGGLYGRVTRSIKLYPFSLKECEEYFRENGFLLSRYDIVQSQMILGGIPYYFNCFNREYSFSQNIDALFWGESPKLQDEFDKLFASVFSKPEEMKRIVLALAKRRKGYTRNEISELTGIDTGGNFTKMLKALVESNFVEQYYPFGESKKEIHYKLTDPFCLFYSKFLSGVKITDPYFWTNSQNSQQIISWRGFAFEDLCFRHIKEIKEALGISGVSAEYSAWNVPGDANSDGAQVDLLIRRKDNVTNLCEMKFYSDEFEVSKAFYRTMLSRTNRLMEHLPKKHVIHPTLVTTFGLKRNEYSGVFNKVITLDDLF